MWLGSTFTCCRCHDHKYDPITQRDYAMYDTFNQMSETGAASGGQVAPVLDPPPTRNAWVKTGAKFDAVARGRGLRVDEFPRRGKLPPKRLMR